MDNIFVMSIIFTSIGVPRIYQHRVLFWGILGAIVMRALLIGVGEALIKTSTGFYTSFGISGLYRR